MARGQHPNSKKGHKNLTKPKKGEVRNPNGRPKGILTLMENEGLSRQEIYDTVAQMLTMPQVKLKMIKDDPETPSVFALAASIIVNGIDKGDHARLDAILDRVFGKVAQRGEIALRNVTEVKEEDMKILEIVRNRKESQH